ncbi:MAG: ECF-type sigma factor [Longimicrobiales bacterium]|nr:ECF-type sigma factor [Longimicrobiales bacterium]
MEPTPNGELDAHFSAAYEELRRLAGSVAAGERAVTLSPTALVGEAYLKLARAGVPTPDSPLHFRRIAARAMRQVLVEAARRRRAAKRGSAAAPITLDEAHAVATGRDLEVLALDEALTELAALDPRQARLVEYRFFGGLEITEIAALLGVSESTLHRDWRAARAWLAVRLG